MTRLVHAAEHQGEWYVWHETSGYTHIVRAEIGAERVRRAVLAAAPEVISEGAHDLHAEGIHRGFIVGQVQEGVVHLWALGNGFDQRHLLGAQRGEDSLHIGGLHTRLENI